MTATRHGSSGEGFAGCQLWRHAAAAIARLFDRKRQVNRRPDDDMDDRGYVRCPYGLDRGVGSASGRTVVRGSSVGESSGGYPAQ
jgi:hypothetical protein